jgi:UDP-N-acetyl-D-glucosamine dehydrogenase
MMSQNSELRAVASDWQARARTGALKVCVIGMGYVGLPLARAFVDAGLTVVGFDIDQGRVDQLNSGESYFHHIDNEVVAAMVATGRFSATTIASKMTETDALLLCVPTPLNIHREPDLTFVERTTEVVAQHLRAGQLVVLESTTYPGTSEDVMRPILESISGLKAHKDFAIAYSPEREDPGNPNFSTGTIPKVVGANTDAERDMAVALYGTITTPVPVSDLKTAEAVKLTENIYRLVNIALVNELNQVFGEMGIDVWEVVDAAKTKPFGFHAFYPGPGLGGHCIPIDPFYLTWKARAHGVSTRFIELAGDVTAQLPRLTIEKLSLALNDKLQKSVNGARVLVMGLSYKKNVDDMRESPSLHLVELLKQRGAEVEYYDPYLPIVPFIREHPEMEGWKGVDFNAATLSGFDCALISTDHDNVDYELLLQSVPLVVDSRNACAKFTGQFRDKIVKV